MERLLSSSYTWWHVGGYTFAALVPMFPLDWIARDIWRIIYRGAGIDDRIADQLPVRFLPLLIGALERPLYVAALLLGNPQFVGMWLALKVAGGWNGWTQDRTYTWETGDGGRKERKIGGREIFNKFLVGSAVSLLNALAAVAAIDYGTHNEPARAVAVALAATALTGAVLLATWRKAGAMAPAPAKSASTPTTGDGAGAA